MVGRGNLKNRTFLGDAFLRVCLIVWRNEKNVVSLQTYRIYTTCRTNDTLYVNMKKFLSCLLFGALVLGFNACNEDVDDPTKDDGGTPTDSVSSDTIDTFVPQLLMSTSSEIIEANTTTVSFRVALSERQAQGAVFAWELPAGTLAANGTSLSTSTDSALHDIRFSYIGTQEVRVQVKKDGKVLCDLDTTLHVGYNDKAPTLYYAVQGGNIMALKLIDHLPANVQNNPIDLGVSAGGHAFNLLFADTTLYVVDAGEQFGFVDDTLGIMGDGKILAVAHDGSRVETVISNAGQYFGDDPYFGYIENEILYFANRNTGLIPVPLRDRNKVYSPTDYPYFVQNNLLTYYQQGMSYGCMNACFGKIGSVWYWCKNYSGNGIFRFENSDILAKPVTSAQGTLPAAGIALPGMRPKAYVYNKQTQEFFFTTIDYNNYSGFYRCANLEELNSITDQRDAGKYRILHSNGGSLIADLTSTNKDSEGQDAEAVGICQLALDERTGCVYFGYRSAPDSEVPAGLMRYNPQTGKVETVIEGVKIYGVTINPTPSKLL